MKQQRLRRLLLPLLLPFICLLGACATVGADYEQPKVDVVGITKSETDTAALQFTLQLRVVNPNPEPIDLQGLFYALNLDGIEVVTGVAKDLPLVEGYSETVVSVGSAASLVNSIRLSARLMDRSGDDIPYELRAKLGTRSRWLPATTVTEKGMIQLR